MTTSPKFLVQRQLVTGIQRGVMIVVVVIGRTVMLIVMPTVAAIVVVGMIPLLLLAAAVRALNHRHSKMIPRGTKFTR